MWSLDHGAQSAPTSTLDESLPHSHAELPWALQESEVPAGAEPEEGVSVADLDTAVAVADGEGLRHPMTVAVPADDAGTFSAIGYAFDDPTDERTVHVDQYGGTVRSTYGYDDYPVLAQVVSQGIALHEGRSLGLANMAVSALFCVGVIALCLTGPLMWWRRRPRGRRTGAPRGRMPLRTTPWLAAGVIALGVFLPLFGLSLLVVLLLDHLVLRRVGALGGLLRGEPHLTWTALLGFVGRAGPPSRRQSRGPFPSVEQGALAPVVETRAWRSVVEQGALAPVVETRARFRQRRAAVQVRRRRCAR